MSMLPPWSGAIRVQHRGHLRYYLRCHPTKENVMKTMTAEDRVKARLDADLATATKEQKATAGEAAKLLEGHQKAVEKMAKAMDAAAASPTDAKIAAAQEAHTLAGKTMRAYFKALAKASDA